MHHHYRDIRGLIDREPVWFDEHAVPRYSEFSTASTANIYCDRAILLEISCQNCEHEFKVCMTSCILDRHMKRCGGLWDQIKDGSIHYGDPPNIECCGAGPTMNCNDLRVLEAWERRDCEWHQMPEYEVVLNEDL